MDSSFQSIAYQIMKSAYRKFGTLFCAEDNVVNSPTDKDRYKNYYE